MAKIRRYDDDDPVGSDGYSIGHLEDYPGPFYRGTFPDLEEEIAREGFKESELSGSVYLTSRLEEAKAFGDIVYQVNLPDDWELEEGEYFDVTEEVESMAVPTQYVGEIVSRQAPNPNIPDEESLLEMLERTGQVDVDDALEERGIDDEHPDYYRSWYPVQKRMRSLEARGKAQKHHLGSKWIRPEGGRLRNG